MGNISDVAPVGTVPPGLSEVAGARTKNICSQEEEDVLNKIREASEKARAVKAKIRSLAGSESPPALMEEARIELENLRRIRDELETERIAAGEERMRMLGHL